MVSATYEERSVEDKSEPAGLTGPHLIEMGAWISCAPFERLLDMKIVEAAGGRAVLSMPFRIDLAQGAGLMHGGALVSLADTAVVMAIKSLVPPGTHFATISLETVFLYPVKQGVVIARARVVSQEDRIVQGQAIVYNEQERPVLEFTSTFKMARDRRIRGVVFRDSEDLGERI
ncbi:MAG: PaaI family thioesterase [Desulfovibrionales bacterium]|nr:PaaI family thioesterase [Desulfovibrionales bacterium]